MRKITIAGASLLVLNLAFVAPVAASGSHNNVHNNTHNNTHNTNKVHNNTHTNTHTNTHNNTHNNTNVHNNYHTNNHTTVKSNCCCDGTTANHTANTATYKKVNSSKSVAVTNNTTNVTNVSTVTTNEGEAGRGAIDVEMASTLAATTPVVQSVAGQTLPETGGMLDIFMAALLALGFAGGKRVYDQRKANSLV